MHVIHPGCGSVTVLSSILSVLLHDIRLLFDLNTIFQRFFFSFFLFNWCVDLFMTESGIVSDGCDSAFVVMLCAKKKGYFNKIPPCFFGFFLSSLCFHILIQKKRKETAIFLTSSS